MFDFYGVLEDFKLEDFFADEEDDDPDADVFIEELETDGDTSKG